MIPVGTIVAIMDFSMVLVFVGEHSGSIQNDGIFKPTWFQASFIQEAAGRGKSSVEVPDGLLSCVRLR